MIASTSTAEHSPRLQPSRRSITVTTRREDGDAEDGDEDDEKDVRDRRQRPRYGNDARDEQDGSDRHRDLERRCELSPLPANLTPPRSSALRAERCA